MRTLNSLLTVFCCSLAFNAVAETDGLSLLKKTLSELQGSLPISAIYQRAYKEISDADDKNDRKETNGLMRVLVTKDEQGLQVIYPKILLATIEQETGAKAIDEDAETPTLNAVNGINAAGVHNQLSSANKMLREINKATFIDEQAYSYNDIPTRLLRFNLPLEAVINDAKTRDYVSTFEGVYKIVIDQDGVPLETQIEFKGKGRAFLVLSVKVDNSEVSKFEVVDNRLVRVHHEYSNAIYSTFGDNMSSGVNILTILENQ
jgi:hypothetical protein